MKDKNLLKSQLRRLLRRSGTHFHLLYEPKHSAAEDFAARRNSEDVDCEPDGTGKFLFLF